MMTAFIFTLFNSCTSKTVSIVIRLRAGRPGFNSRLGKW